MIDKTAISVCIIWDFDAAIGRINASYPYNYHFELLEEDIKNVEKIIDLLDAYNFKNTFAVTGFSAEPGVYPYSIRELIKKIFLKGHEIASHSWKHEWIPFLTNEQLIRSMVRSKTALESCIGKKGAVVGFVPPFNKPSTWIRKASISLGDRAFYPLHKNANLDNVIKLAEKTGYKWIRVSYRNLFQKILGNNPSAELNMNWEKRGQINVIPQNYVGFDIGARNIVDKAISKNSEVIVCGHPHGLSIHKEEHIDNLISFLTHLEEKKNQNLIEIRTMSEIIA